MGTLQNNASNWNISQIHGMYQNMGFSAGAGMGLQNFPLQNSDQFQGAQIPSPQVMRNIEAQNLIQAQNLSNNVDPGEHQHQQNSNGGGVSTNNVCCPLLSPARTSNHLPLIPRSMQPIFDQPRSPPPI